MNILPTGGVWTSERRLMSTLVSRLPATCRTDTFETAFAARVADNQRRVIQIAFSVLLDRHDAEEVAQEAFLRAYGRFGGLREPDKFRAWVGRIVFRLALNRRRSRLRRLARDGAWQRSQPEPNGRAHMHPSENIQLREVEAAIDVLPEKLRVVLLLCAVEEMHASDVATVLRIPVGTVRSRLHLARKQLLKSMSP